MQARRKNIMTACACAVATLVLTSTMVSAQSVGPVVGEVSSTDAHLLYRSNGISQTLRLSVLAVPGGEEVGSDQATSQSTDDYVAKFHITGLQPKTLYDYKLEDVGGATNLIAGADGEHHFRTALPSGDRGAVTAAFISGGDPSSEVVYDRMAQIGIDYFYQCGDTPYIDNSSLSVMRSKRRGFLITPFMAALIRNTPTLVTWDDHDFGMNNSNGATTPAAHKANSRQAFIEYTAQGQYGNGTEGVYLGTELGAMDIFVLDPRWWSQTEASPVDPSQKTCFGPDQWQWIKDALLASRAPFKILAMGQIWQDKKNSETDDMFTYWHERDALLDFVRDEGIPGVVLVGGDIHVSRHLIHANRVGYDLHDFITSPAHNRTIPSLDVPHPDLEWSSIQPHQFLTLTANTQSRTPVLTARFYLHDGTIQREVVLPYDELVPRAGSDLGSELRAWWTFDGTFTNNSVLGNRLVAGPENGASLVADGGLSGGAVSFARSGSQYLYVPRSVLHDNSPAHTVSMWYKPTTLPAHGSGDRHSLLETTGNGLDPGRVYAISLGLRASTTHPDMVNLQLFTVTLRPATGITTAPTALPQGGFDTEVARSLLSNAWTHVACTCDSEKIRLLINGAPVSEFTLPTPGPLAENGGLVIGGHRSGVGRNLDGMMDEVALWSRVLTDTEIDALYNAGTPPVLPTATTVADTDGDSMPDWWEKNNGLDPSDPSDAVASGDGDMAPAFFEFQMGGSPLIDDSEFYTTMLDIATEDPSEGPWVYRNPATGTISIQLDLDHTTNLLAGWSPLGADTPGLSVSTNGNQVILELPADSADSKFIGIKIEE